ncbi:MAG: hypothetical protein K1X88_14855 [Nannocystaceae bacterium]|nr:hypothetical protein [Nannocystaceae bacterium]
MPPERDSELARALRRREPAAVDALLREVLRPDAALVERPWGGSAIAAHKRIVAPAAAIGESFELAAAPWDDEAATHASVVALPDGGALPLGTLLCAAPQILGAAHVEAFGPTTPLLPKLLDVHAMLSVQAHPPGQPELYVVLAADPGATLQLGLAQPLDRDRWRAWIDEGTALQRTLAAACADDATRAAAASAWLLQPDAPLPASLAPWSTTLLRLAAIDAALLGTMHAIPVAPGTVVHNRVADPHEGRSSATLHALGNLQGRRILALELRVAGPTWRVWDHGRLPARALQAERALDGLPLTPDDAAGFVIAQQGQAFAIDDGVLATERVIVGATPWRREGRDVAVFVHAARGAVTLAGPADVPVRIEPGCSAWVPACWSHWHAQAVADEAELVLASVCVGPTRLALRTRALVALRDTVARDAGAREVVVVANGGDGPLVQARTAAQAPALFGRSGHTRVVAHEERTRRGQLLGLLDALAHVRAATPPLREDGVALGIMLPGQGTRLSPLTQRLHGIKPFAPMPIRAGDRWLDAGSASLWSWGLVTAALERAGFRGVAWKWGDEPQLPSQLPADSIAAHRLGLERVDAVRFGMRVALTEDLARNKEWLLQDKEGRLAMQVRRRPLAALQARLDRAPAGTRALVNLGSPALSFAMIDALAQHFGALPGWLDVDGYLFEALTHDPALWAEEAASDAGLQALLQQCPDFYARVAAVRDTLEQRRGAALAIAVIDLGADTWWGDMGQLSRAREAFAALARPDDGGEFARRLAAIETVVPDRFGNRVVGDSVVPDDGRVRDSVIIDTWLVDTVTVVGAVVIDSELGAARLDPGAVVVDTTAAAIHGSTDSLVIAACGEVLGVAAAHVLTTIVDDPLAADPVPQPWRFDMREDPGAAANYRSPVGDNPASFADKFAQMRQRQRPPAAVERAVLQRREALLGSIAARAGLGADALARRVAWHRGRIH